MAFSLHRFVREYVIKNAQTEIRECQSEGEHPPKVKELCKEGACCFMESYRKHCRQDLIPLPDDFETELGKYIRCSNMDKMIAKFKDEIVLQKDVRLRDEARRLGEVRKFVRFMKESEAFEF